MKLPSYAGWANALLIPVLIIAIWIYWPTLDAGYAYDDFTVFLSRANFYDDLDWITLSAPIIDGSPYFRPTVLLTWRFEVLAGGFSSRTSHAVNLVLFLINLGLLFAVSMHLFRCHFKLPNPSIRAALVTLMYAVHPSLTEAVAWVSGRFDLLLTTLCLLCIFLELRLKQGPARLALIPTTFLVALGTKETAVVLPLVLLLVRICYDDVAGEGRVRGAVRILKMEIKLVGLMAGALALYLYLRIQALDSLLHVFVPDKFAGFQERIHLSLATFAFYMREAFSPFTSVSPLHPVHEYMRLGIENLLWILGSVLLLVGLASRALLGSQASLLLMGAFVCLFPVLNFLPLTIGESIGNDRFLCLPLVFIAIAAGLLRPLNIPAVRPRAQKVAAGVALTLWAAMAAATSSATVPIWRNDQTLWRFVYDKYPESAEARRLFIAAMMLKNQLDEVGPIFKKSIADPNGMDMDMQLAYADYLIRTGDPEESLLYLAGIAATFPEYHGMAEEAGRRQMIGTQVARVLYRAHWLKALALLSTGNGDSAFESMENALWYRPDFPIALAARIILLAELGRISAARDAAGHLRSRVGAERMEKLCRDALVLLSYTPYFREPKASQMWQTLVRLSNSRGAELEVD